MKATGIIRPVDNLGRLVLPAELRHKFGVKDGGSFEIFVDDDKIILKKYEPTCVFCGSHEDITSFKERRICKACINELTSK